MHKYDQSITKELQVLALILLGLLTLCAIFNL